MCYGFESHYFHKKCLYGEMVAHGSFKNYCEITVAWGFESLYRYKINPIFFLIFNYFNCNFVNKYIQSNIMFDMFKNVKYLKPLLIIMAIILGLNAISFVFSYWKIIVFLIVVYLGFYLYNSVKGKK
ncbi:MAG: hypothetical protein RLZZ546_1838 [Bacteroidota bacterium]